MTALLDTGCPYSILDPQVAECIEANLGAAIRDLHLDIRGRVFTGALYRTQLTLVAEKGKSLSADVIVFVAPDIPPGLNLLGYGGFLEHMRIGLDGPQNLVYFGRD